MGALWVQYRTFCLFQAASENKLYLRGFVASVDRRLIFVHEARVDAVDRDGLHLRGGTLDLRILKNVMEKCSSPKISTPPA